MIKDIKIKQKPRVVDVLFESGEMKTYSFATLREHSPSAENKHEEGTDFSNVLIVGAAPVGNYGIRFLFDDGHDTGIFRFDSFATLDS